MSLQVQRNKSRLIDVYKFLESKGYEVYFPAQKTTEAKTPYIVVRDEGGSRLQQFSSWQYLYSLLVYMPYARFGDLEPLVEKIKIDMKEMQPMIMPTHFQTPSFPDDGVKAYMISIQYRNVRKF